jgi:hypothetical protein
MPLAASAPVTNSSESPGRNDHARLDEDHGKQQHIDEQLVFGGQYGEVAVQVKEPVEQGSQH